MGLFGTSKRQVREELYMALDEHTRQVKASVLKEVREELGSICESVLESVIMLSDTELIHSELALYSWHSLSTRDTVIKTLKKKITSTVEKEFLTNYKAAVNTEEYIDNLIARINKKQLEVN